jgi:hypothetical protein
LNTIWCFHHINPVARLAIRSATRFGGRLSRSLEEFASTTELGTLVIGMGRQNEPRTLANGPEFRGYVEVETLKRIWLAIRAWWRILTDAGFAAEVEPLFSRAPTGPDLRVLAVLQRDGRLIDFLKEDLDLYSDAQVGAAVRDIHRGCRKSLNDYLTIEPIIDAAEEASVTVPTDFDPAAIRLVGNVNGSPPFQGVLKHHGWRVRSVHLPLLPAARDDKSVLSPAEVELP